MVKARKVKAKKDKATDKVLATPTAMTADEKATQQVQAAPLGLNGDTAKKTKKKHVKGEAKERLQPKPKEAEPDSAEESGWHVCDAVSPGGREQAGGSCACSCSGDDACSSGTAGDDQPQSGSAFGLGLIGQSKGTPQREGFGSRVVLLCAGWRGYAGDL